MKFRKGNKISYSQDFRLLRGLPHGIDFKVSYNNGRTHSVATLTAKGYGDLNNEYGNGKLFIFKAFVSKAVWDRIHSGAVWDEAKV